MPTEINQYVHYHGAKSKGKILIVVSSPAVSTQTGWPIGFWASELTHPLFVFRERGYDVDIISTNGGKIEMDSYSDPRDASGYSAHDVISLGFLQQEHFLKQLASTESIANVVHSNYDAIFLSGGQGPVYTFRNNKELESLLATFYEAGKPVGVVCHATTILLTARTSDGNLLVENKSWTGFSNAEEDIADQAVGLKIQPYRIEEEAKKIPNTSFKTAAPFSSYAISDGLLVTGQQQNSGAAAAELLVALLEKNHA